MFAQQLPSLEQLRLAAEGGDPNAEHKFAEVLLSKSDYANAFKWFQKAADALHISENLIPWADVGLAQGRHARGRWLNVCLPGLRLPPMVRS